MPVAGLSRKHAPRPVRGHRARGASAPPRILSLWLPLALLISGIAVLLYPVISTLLNNQQQAKIANEYVASVAQADTSQLRQELDDAVAYNSNLNSQPILDPWLDSQRPDTPEYQAYLGELDGMEVMARVRVPSIDVNLPIYHGTEDSTLRHGIGHLFGTSLPVGGVSTHSVLTGHTGLGSATMFDRLTEVSEGDVILVDSAGQTAQYVVSRIHVIEPHDTDSLRKVPGEDLLTLITCTPYGVNSHRLVVTAHRVPLDAEVYSTAYAPSEAGALLPWMKAIIFAVGMLIAVTAIIAIVVVRRNRRDNGGPVDAPADPSISVLA